MLPRRLEMIGRTIRDTVSDAIQNRLSDPRIQGMISVTRVETSGDTAFFYCRDATPLLAALSGAGGLRYLHRAANLEDVFIKLTGRELRD